MIRKIVGLLVVYAAIRALAINHPSPSLVFLGLALIALAFGLRLVWHRPRFVALVVRPVRAVAALAAVFLLTRIREP